MLICALFLLGMACSQEEVVPPKDSNAEEIAQKIDEYQTPGDHVVTAAEALSRAETILSRWETRSTPRVVKSCEYFVAEPATRSLADTIEVAFHLINYEDNGGFAMVAADERATDIYAYSDEGQLTAADFEQNPGLSIYKEIATEAYQAEVRGIITLPDPWPGGDPVGPVTPTPNDGPNGLLIQMPDGTWCIGEVVNDFSRIVGPWLKTKWNQWFPYNHYLSGFPTGCGPVAIGQIMAYYRHPASFNGHVFDWDKIECDYKESILYPNYLEPAYLLWVIGLLGDVSYSMDGSSMDIDLFDNTFATMGYHSTDHQTFKGDQIVSHINLGRPVCMAGSDSDKNGHAFVVDGCNIVDYDMILYHKDPPYLVYGRKSYYSLTYHVNWGWGGLDDGYFYLPDGIDYNKHVKVIYDILPNS